MKTYFEKLKSKKCFEKNDLLVYLALILTLTILFLAFYLTNGNATALGFKVCVNDEEIFSFTYSDENFSVNEDYADFITVDKVEKTVTIYLNAQKTQFNLISYDLNSSSVKMKNSTCSLSKDCVYEPKISDKGTIFCAPHNLKIVPITNGFVATPPVVGG